MRSALNYEFIIYASFFNKQKKHEKNLGQKIHKSFQQVPKQKFEYQFQKS